MGGSPVVSKKKNIILKVRQIVFFVFFVFYVALPEYSYAAKKSPNLCAHAFLATHDEASGLSALLAQQPKSIHLSIPGLATPQEFLFFNTEVATRFQADLKSSDQMVDYLLFLFDKGFYDIPMDKSGFVTAAAVGNHAGNYGRFVWFRDFARIYQGAAAALQSLEIAYEKNPTPKLKTALKGARKTVRKIARAMLKLVEDPHWTEKALNIIKDPGAHLDPTNGHNFVIWVRRLLEPLSQDRAPTPEELSIEQNWGHKQNDALSELQHSILDALQKGHLAVSDIKDSAYTNFIFLADYFVKIQFWKMWDVGAWEAEHAKRTSSIAMVMSFLERFQRGFNSNNQKTFAEMNGEEKFFTRLKSHWKNIAYAVTTPHIIRAIEADLQTEPLQETIDTAHDTVCLQLGCHWSQEGRERPVRPMEVIEGHQPPRYEDTALLHIMWHFPEVLDLEDRLHILKNVRILERPAGYIRYTRDWFLNSGGEFPRNYSELGLQAEQIAIPNGQGGYRPATAEDLEQAQFIHAVHMADKDIHNLETLTGHDLEAQWTLPDSYLTHNYAELYMQTQDEQYLAKARYHFARASALITGENQTTTEGLPVEAFKMGEAYIPLRVFDGNEVRTIYMASPNSPLNWSHAEYKIAANSLLLALLHRERTTSPNLKPNH